MCRIARRSVGEVAFGAANCYTNVRRHVEDCHVEVIRVAVRDGIVYLQVIRGIASRGRAFPKSVNPVPVVVTHQADSPILNGVTRLAVFDIICREGYSLAERPFALDEAKAATEAFLTSTSVDLLPVVKIDSDPVVSAAPGALSRRLRNCCLAHAAAAERPP
jgi:hypothetical protein